MTEIYMKQSLGHCPKLCYVRYISRASLQTGVYHLAVFDCTLSKTVKDCEMPGTSHASLKT
jgi:hypothetical protein